MIVTTSDRLGFIIDGVADARSVSLTPEQVQALKAVPALQGITDELALIEAACKPRQVPTSTPKVPRLEWRRDELYNALLQMKLADGVTPFFLALKAQQSNPNPQVAALCQMVELTLNGPLVAISLENEGVAAAMAGLLGISLLTQAQYDFITLKDNPEQFETLPSIVEELFGFVAVLTREDARMVIE